METTLQQVEHRINPWVWIWFKPRAAMRHILRTDSSYRVFSLGALAGISRAVDQAVDNSLGDNLSFVGVLIFCIIVGAIIGALSLFPMGAYYRWVGSWFGGKGNSEEVRAAIAWSSLPNIALLVLFIPVVLIFGEEWFKSDGNLDGNIFSSLLLIGFTVASFVLLIWSFVLMVKCMAEVHEVSAWKGLAILVVGALIVGIPILLFSLL